MGWTEEQYAAFLKASNKSSPKKTHVRDRNAYTSNVSGWRIIGKIKYYYRSLYEINFAHFLEWQRRQGLIKDWLHEPRTFEFPKDAYKLGPFYYKPDFKVIDCDGSHRWVEVKGFLNPASKKKIARFNKHHGKAEGLIELIGPEWFKAAFKQGLNKIIPGWESLPK